MFSVDARSYQPTASPSPSPLPLIRAVVGSTETQRGRVLVVDDDEMVRMVISAVLVQKGYKVTEARNGEDALRQCASATFDLAVVDLFMPRLNGLETLRALRGVQPHLRGLLLSGVADFEEWAADGAEANIAFLQKPFDNVELIRMVDGLVSWRS